MTLMSAVSYPRPRRMRFDYGEKRVLTHYLFKYPAKFHPPVARYLLDTFTAPGETVLDPFCGSGTLLVEAAVAGRSAIGIDVDPVAAFVSRVKTTRYNLEGLRRSAERLLERVAQRSRSDAEYERRMFEDVTIETVSRIAERESLDVPRIPNLYHWFRRYVVVDLCRILKCIESARVSDEERNFFRLCFASIIRPSSNADPVPVSGLEVTSHMRRLDEKGRLVNPFALFRRAVERGVAAAEEYGRRLREDVVIRVVEGDVTVAPAKLGSRVDAIITSPPYNIAVNYYRRHQLEMFWLGFTRSQEERLALHPKYIGRDKVAARDPFVADAQLKTPLVRSWEAAMRKVAPERANAFKHYAVAMSKAFSQMSRVLRAGGYAVFVVGDSTWNGRTIPTGKLFVELAGSSMELVEHFWYPVANRYMSYSRRNGANIDREYVLVFRRVK